MGKLLYFFDPLFVSKNITVISPLKRQIISEDFLQSLLFSVTELSKPLPTCMPAGADKQMNFSSLLMFTQHLTGSSLSIYFNIFNESMHEWFFLMQTCEGSHIKVNTCKYMTTWKALVNMCGGMVRADFLHHSLSIVANSGHRMLKGQSSTIVLNRELHTIINLRLWNFLNTLGSNYCCAYSHSYRNIC